VDLQKTGERQPTAMLPHPDLSASLPALQTFILNFMMAKCQNPKIIEEIQYCIVFKGMYKT